MRLKDLVPNCLDLLLGLEEHGLGFPGFLAQTSQVAM